MDKLKKQTLSLPFYLFLLPVFFVLHGVVEKFPLTGFEILKVLGIYTGTAILLFILFWLLFKNIRKASFFAFCVLAFQLFFGSAHDFLKNNVGGVFFIKYSFLVPFAMVALGTSIFFAKRSGKNFIQLTKYLNILMLVLVLVDAATLMIRDEKVHKEDLSALFRTCDTCNKPDVYLIVLDEYAGRQELTEMFSFDNSVFENNLKDRGFHVVNNPRSNYNYTTYSMASLLNMQYIKNLESLTANQNDLFTCLKLIRENELARFFRKEGYAIYNSSVFDLEGNNRAATSKYFIPVHKMLTAQTFTRRFNYDLGFHFASKKIIERILKDNVYTINTIEAKTKKIAAEKTGQPKFVYTHFLMPHHPYFFDSSGREASIEKLEDSYKMDKKAYIEYLLYTNKKILGLVDHIKTVSAKPPAIILMSDHGFRQSNDSSQNKYHFMTLNAIHLPTNNYKSFYDGMSHVNQFRIFLNTQFRQQLPLLKDSSIFIWEK